MKFTLIGKSNDLTEISFFNELEKLAYSQTKVYNFDKKIKAIWNKYYPDASIVFINSTIDYALSLRSLIHYTDTVNVEILNYQINMIKRSDN